MVEDYARTLPGPESLARKEERIFLALALDGIRAHPLRYGQHVARSFAKLLVRGLGLTYPLPADRSSCAAGWQDALAGAGAPANWAARAPGSRGPGGLVLGPSRALIAGSRAFTQGLEPVFPWLATGVLLTFLGRRAWRRPEAQDTCLLAALTGMAVGSYALLLAFVLVSEPPRFAAPVPDHALVTLVLLAEPSLRRPHEPVRHGESARNLASVRAGEAHDLAHLSDLAGPHGRAGWQRHHPASQSLGDG
ncbi:MAG TPA: hypothetical protein PLS53_01705 [Thermoanaerobaculaceae bacterium]|nr:hypothetical protein [Thermoanaerobaculaceae bacterium]HPS76851.1 hypothetical protein [Thermoanaerobaculaceae bacterium]